MKVELEPLIELSRDEFPHLEAVRSNQFRLTDLEKEDLKKAIEIHISDIGFEDSCALFGGYALKVDGRYELFPQCCGMLSEIIDWEKLLQPDFEPFYLSECHPAPKFERIENEVVIECDSTFEAFVPETANHISVDYDSLSQAVKNSSSVLEQVAKKMDELSKDFGRESLSELMIWDE